MRAVAGPADRDASGRASVHMGSMHHLGEPACPSRACGAPPRVALLLAATLIVALTAVPGAAQEPAARGIERVCPAPGDPEPPGFPDIGAPHDDAIVCATGYGLVSGFEDGSFRPATPITRGQMASFAAAWIETATGLELRQPDELPFSDVEGSVHVDAVAALAQAQVVGGRPDGTYGPQEELTRGQFARIAANAVSYADVFSVDGPLPPDDAEVEFSDVADTTFEADIGALAGVGIASGDADGAFHPGEAVTRGQLTTFLLRAADYLDRHQRWEPTAAVTTIVAELTDGDTGASTEPSATASLVVNAFNGTLAYTLELSALEGPFGGGDGAAIRVGELGEDGPVALELADGAALDGAEDGVVQGVVYESDSAVRFADLLADPDDAYVSIATDAAPNGAVRGQLRVATASG